MDAARFSSRQNKMRVDAALVARGLAETPQRALALIMAGKVRINEQQAMKPGEMIAADARIEIAGLHLKYASRAGLKLEGALEDFSVNVEGLICADIGASNGGFTDCLLQRGARRVYAIDVNTKQLDWKLQRDARVVAVEKNARYLKPRDIEEAVEFVTIDLSFISVAKLIEAATAIARPGATFLILVKPQFELPKALVGQGGIVRDQALHERAIESVRAAAANAGLTIFGVRPSRVAGAEGNQEYFLHARLSK